MSAVTVPAHDHDVEHAHEAPYEERVKANRLGLWLFCFSELFLFGALLAARFVLWGNTRPELSQEVGLAASAVLLLSSYFVYRGETGARFGDWKRFQRSTLIGAMLGLLFLVMVVVFEWNVFGLEGSIGGIEIFGHLSTQDGVYGGVFYAMTGMHALHVISGVALLLIVYFNGRRGRFTVQEHWGVEGTAIYWHYVDVIWMFFYPALYLIGHVAH